MSKNSPEIDLGAIEEAVRNEPMVEMPARPLATRLIQNKPTDSELVADFKDRLRANFMELALIKDDMKREGGFDFNFGWMNDAFGHFAPGPITIFKVFP